MKCVPKAGKVGDAGPMTRSRTREGSVLYAKGFSRGHKAIDSL